MTEQTNITSDDKIWAAVGYPIGLIALIMLFIEDKKNRPFIKYHAVQSLALWVAIFIVSVIMGITVILAPCAGVLWLVSLWPAYEAYNGKMIELPVIGPFIKKQGWV